MKSVYEMGFENPTPIQEQTLPILLGDPTDFLGLAATGTGKTVAFALPLLERINPNLRAVQGLILCPTRELAVQVSGQIDLLGKHLGIRALPIYGGTGYGDQIRGLKNGAKVVVGTPGRVVDHMNKGTLDLSSLKTVILDEADEMISMGFKEDLETILSKTPRESCNAWLFSATMGREVRKVADTHLRDPQFVEVNRSEMLPEAIEQIYYRTHESDKPEIVCKLIDAADDFYGIIFCQTKALVADLTQYLNGRGYDVDCLHGDMDQTARDRTMKNFRERGVRILVCTDVASRGLDVKDITHVINYSLPRELDNYVHRIGRTARSGKTGFAMSLVTPSHRGLVSRIEHMTKSKMREGKLPSRREIGAKKVNSKLSKFQNADGYERVLEIMSEEWKNAVRTLSGEEIAARFLALNFREIFSDREANSADSVEQVHRPARAPVLRARTAASVIAPVIAPVAAPVTAPVAAPTAAPAVNPAPITKPASNRKERRAHLQPSNPWQPPRRNVGELESPPKMGVILPVTATPKVERKFEKRKFEKPRRFKGNKKPRFGNSHRSGHPS